MNSNGDPLLKKIRVVRTVTVVDLVPMEAYPNMTPTEAAAWERNMAVPEALENFIVSLENPDVTPMLATQADVVEVSDEEAKKPE